MAVDDSKTFLLVARDVAPSVPSLGGSLARVDLSDGPDGDVAGSVELTRAGADALAVLDPDDLEANRPDATPILPPRFELVSDRDVAADMIRAYLRLVERPLADGRLEVSIGRPAWLAEGAFAGALDVLASLVRGARRARG